ncbi:hypothetical protein AC1031_016247 [Aphanomyces cochlioides]|nr:hypothetical protein AC1031_016247 [Aphanomyces cochlioides]
MSKKLPLPRSFFSCPPLSSQEIADYKAQALSLVMDVIRTANINSGQYTWDLVSDDGDLKIYKGVDSISSLYCGIVEVAGTINEAIDLFRTDTQEAAAEYTARFLTALVDSSALYSIASPTETSKEKVDIHWLALKSGMKARDVCVLSCLHEFEMNGRRGWTAAYQSVELDCCPSLKSSHGLVRTFHLGSGYIFVESDRPGYIQASFLSHVDSSRSASSSEWGSDSSALKQCRNLVDLDRFLRENRLSATPFLGKNDVVPVASRRICFLCRKKFGSFGRKTNCFKCGEVMCTSCNHHWHANVNGKPGRIRVCTKCSSGTVVAQPSLRAVTASFPSMTSRFGPVDGDSWQSRNSTMSVDTDFSIFRESFESDGTIDLGKRNSNSPILGDQRSRNGSNPRFLYQDQWGYEELHRRAMLLQLTQPQSQRSPQGDRL